MRLKRVIFFFLILKIQRQAEELFYPMSEHDSYALKYLAELRATLKLGSPVPAGRKTPAAVSHAPPLAEFAQPISHSAQVRHADSEPLTPPVFGTSAQSPHTAEPHKHILPWHPEPRWLLGQPWRSQIPPLVLL